MLALGFGACRRDSNQTPQTQKEGSAAVEPDPHRTTDPAAAVMAVARSLPSSDVVPEVPDAKAPSSGGTLRVHLDSAPATLNPLGDENLATMQVVWRLVYEPLVDCVGEGGAPTALLATSWRTEPDGLSLTLTLREDVAWHDGRKLSPVDVLVSLESVLRAASPTKILHALAADIESVQIQASTRSVSLRLRRPSGLALRALCEIPILPAHLLTGSATERAALGRLPIGSGPFRMETWDRNRNIRLQRNKDYWGQKPWLDGVDFVIETDGARALTRIKRGELDVLPQVLLVHFPDQLERIAAADRLAILRLTPKRYSFLVVNTTVSPLSDVRFRRALSLLWNRERMARDLRKGLSRPIAAPPFGEADTVTPTFDRAAAEALLDQAGYRDTDADGVRDRDGHAIRVRFVYPSGAKLAAKEGQQYALDLRRAGLLLDLEPVDPQSFIGRLTQGAFDLAPATWSGMDDDDPRMQFGPGGPFNFSGYQSPQLDGILDDLVAAPNPAARAKLTMRMADFLASEVPVIFLYRHDSLALAAHSVAGLRGRGDQLDLRGVWLR